MHTVSSVQSPMGARSSSINRASRFNYASVHPACEVSCRKLGYQIDLHHRFARASSRLARLWSLKAVSRWKADRSPFPRLRRSSPAVGEFRTECRGGLQCIRMIAATVCEVSRPTFDSLRKNGVWPRETSMVYGRLRDLRTSKNHRTGKIGRNTVAF